MDGIAAITSRIAEIRGTLASFGGPPVAAAAVTSTARATATSSALGGTSSTSTFATALASEVGRTSATVGSAGTGTLTAKGVPTDLAGYGNGRIPREALSEISGTGHRLWAPAARQYEALSAAAKRDGVTIGITDSYRTYESQVDLAERKGLYKNGGLAAVPGTSDHGWGRSLDLRLDGNALSWMRENGARYGFREDVPRESWHWTYYPPGS
ncbi:M15 family metallopeptidase [Cellulomonas sp. ATA003]|uniref:M15 family metallopeptidase n=1 Tax=Cellulomonas sp. ATA003 TaxID=3073064 RepID=UPI0028738143|nr:M15 family metallopeptidase [Cellulomonas sp. ATA003]WNB84325.1 M15 family metallopeptidase [Cellulomonas sp. ATA003]